MPTYLYHLREGGGFEVKIQIQPWRAGGGTLVTGVAAWRLTAAVFPNLPYLAHSVTARH